MTVRIATPVVDIHFRLQIRKAHRRLSHFMSSIEVGYMKVCPWISTVTFAAPVVVVKADLRDGGEKKWMSLEPRRAEELEDWERRGRERRWCKRRRESSPDWSPGYSQPESSWKEP